jgi:5-methyltetrahydrofolate--homocysteine methyltransferase
MEGWLWAPPPSRFSVLWRLRRKKTAVATRLPFLDLARRRVVVLDGAMGTSLHTYTLDLEKDWLGLENCSEILTQTRPDIIREIHESFLAVGCDAVETNTFGANKIVLAEFDLVDQCFELNKRSAEIAREACAKYETADRPRYVVASMGPGTKLVSMGNTSWEVMLDSYLEQCRGLIAGGVDVLLIETAQDLLQIKCAINAATAAMKEAGVKLPLMAQVSMDLNAGQSMLMGSDSSAVVAALRPYDQLDVLGLNCATGPTELTEHVQYLSKHWPRLISVLPNAGMPLNVEGQAHFPLTPEDFARGMKRFVEEQRVNIIGGCCGTTPAHLKALCEMVGLEAGGQAKPGGAGRAIEPREVVVKAQVSSLITAEDVRQELS